MTPSRCADPEPAARRPALPSSGFDSRDAIEGYLEQLNRSSPLARRDIAQWGGGGRPRLRVQAVPLAAAGAPADDIFLGEAQTSFALDVRAQREVAAGAPYSVGLLLSGSMRVTLAGEAFTVAAGEGVVVDPAEVERTQFSVDAHFVEFALPKSQLLRLGAELAPGERAGTPGLAPRLPGPLAQRVLVMARQTADVLCAGAPVHSTRVMFDRWLEMIALTLQRQHLAAPVQPAPGPVAGRAAAAGAARPRPRRAAPRCGRFDPRARAALGFPERRQVQPGLSAPFRRTPARRPRTALSGAATGARDRQPVPEIGIRRAPATKPVPPRWPRC